MFVSVTAVSKHATLWNHTDVGCMGSYLGTILKWSESPRINHVYWTIFTFVGNKLMWKNAAQMQILSLNWWQYAGRVWSHANSAQPPNSHLAPKLKINTAHCNTTRHALDQGLHPSWPKCSPCLALFILATLEGGHPCLGFRLAFDPKHTRLGSCLDSELASPWPQHPVDPKRLPCHVLYGAGHCLGRTQSYVQTTQSPMATFDSFWSGCTDVGSWLHPPQPAQRYRNIRQPEAVSEWFELTSASEIGGSSAIADEDPRWSGSFWPFGAVDGLPVAWRFSSSLHASSDVVGQSLGCVSKLSLCILETNPASWLLLPENYHQLTTWQFAAVFALASFVAWSPFNVQRNINSLYRNPTLHKSIKGRLHLDQVTTPELTFFYLVSAVPRQYWLCLAIQIGYVMDRWNQQYFVPQLNKRPETINIGQIHANAI